jgi:hypothetical protein
MIQNRQLKNRTVRGAELLTMNEHTFRLRRLVINIIHKANNYLVTNGLDKLPRVEVRIVTKGDNSFAGYAVLNKCIIHISEKTLDYSDVNLLHVVLHEVLHGIGYPHKQKCKLMHPNWNNGSIIESEQWEVFKSYVTDYQNRC